MKNAILFILSIVFSFMITSCESLMGNYLDKAPGVDVTEDTIFSSKVQCTTFLASIYQYGIHSTLPTRSGDAGVESSNGYGNPDPTLNTGSCDESETCAAWYSVQAWNDATIGPNLTDDSERWAYRWKAIRMITIMLDRIDGVPDMTTAEKEQFKAEVRVIRAMNYLEMFKRYGGVPIIRRRLQVNDNLLIPRSSIDSVVNFIVQDCDESLSYLPVNQTGSNKGRVHQGVALAIKSKTLLYAASPLFNTATPYLDFGKNKNLICYGNYSIDRWKSAAAAAKAALDWAPGAGCHLITDKGADQNYQYAWEHYDNDEIILAEKGYGRGAWDWPWSCFSAIAGGNWGQAGITPLLNFVRKYEKRDGTPETWTGVGVTGYGLQEKFAEMDYRFKQTICYNMSSWNKDIPVSFLYQEATGFEGKHSGAISTCYGGFWLQKPHPHIISSDVYWYVPNSTIFQLNEIYLNYAEAMNEAYGPDADNGYGLTSRQALNVIRERSGQPDVPSTETGKDFKARIRNEREIELAFDNHRFYDIRRWKIATDVDGAYAIMNGSMIGIKINIVDPAETNPTITSAFKYTPYVYETRTFSTKMYLHPFGTDEVNKGYLVQNPGY